MQAAAGEDRGDCVRVARGGKPWNLNARCAVDMTVSIRANAPWERSEGFSPRVI